MEMKLTYGCIYLAEGIMAWSYFSALFPRKRSLWVCIASYIIAYGAAFALFDFSTVWINTSFFALINFALVYGLYSCPWKSGIFYSGILTCLSTGLEFITAVVLEPFFGDFNLYQSNYIILAIMGICSKLLYFLSTKLCARIASHSAPGTNEPGHVGLLLFCFSLGSVFVLIVQICTGLTVSLPTDIEYLMLFSSLILLFANIFIFAGYQYTQKIYQEKLSLQLVRQKDEAEEVYFKALEEKYDEQRVVIHDVRRHLTSIKGLIQEGNIDQAKNYVIALEDLPALQNKIRYCDNPMMNVVLSRYGELCHTKKISFQVDVRNKSYDFLLPNEITALFGNLLENAVEAAQGTPDPYIELRVDTPPGSTMFISLINTCAEPPQKDGFGGYLTRKANKEQHGVGQKSVKKIVKKHGGFVKQFYNSETNHFHTSILLKDREEK